MTRGETQDKMLKASAAGVDACTQTESNFGRDSGVLKEPPGWTRECVYISFGSPEDNYFGDGAAASTTAS